MPRPQKPRHCQEQLCPRAFKPNRIPMDRLVKIPLAADELEALRLCDLLGHTQAEAGSSMKISRGTVQRILTRARGKVARALVEGAALVMDDSPEQAG